MVLNDLLLNSKNDIPFIGAQINIHQPTIKEIAYIGEETFYIGCQFLNFSKNNLSEQDKSHLKNQSDFDIFMSVIKDKNPAIQKGRISAFSVLALLFPDYKISIATDNTLRIFKDKEELDENGNHIIEEHFLNNNNFKAFKEILVAMFCLEASSGENINYNPKGKMANSIAEKLRAGREKAAAVKGEQQKVAILDRYLSILAVGEGKDKNELLNYTVYQLFDEFQRYSLKQENDIYMQAKIAGAKGMKEVDNWMKDIHSN